MLINSTLHSRTGMWVGWLICNTVSTFVYVIMCIIHVYHNVMYWLSLSLSLSVSVSVEYVILLHNHTNVVPSSSSSVHSILILMHPHPQCFIMLKNSTLPSGTGMWVGWLICIPVSTFVYVIMWLIHVYHNVMFYNLTNMVLSPSFRLSALSILIHPPSTVFYWAHEFNAPIGNWDVSRVTDMQDSEYIRVCDHCIIHVYHNVLYSLTRLNMMFSFII